MDGLKINQNHNAIIFATIFFNMKSFKSLLIIVLALMSIVVFVACERNNLDSQVDELSVVLSIPEVYLDIGDEFGEMVAYSLDWADRNGVFELENPNEIIELFDKSILSYYEHYYSYSLSELAEFESSIHLYRQIMTSKNELGDMSDYLSDTQLVLLNRIIDIAGDYGKNGFMDQIEALLLPQINDLPEQEREVVYLSITVTAGILDVFNDLIDHEAKSRWNWGVFFCNAAAGGVGVIYGAAVGAFCPPCGVAVGIVVGASLSTVIC